MSSRGDAVNEDDDEEDRNERLRQGDRRESNSWNENRRLIVAKLEQTDRSLRELSAKVDTFGSYSRERIDAVNQQFAKDLGEVRTRLTLVEYSSRIWSAAIAIISSAVMAGIVQIVLSHTGK